ncbi:GIY-YIG nuclease family protein [Heyndrickxia acidicola]|uniref:GIY-YIG nuclease family protein n=1 Tax=Heyndrickxia acidicola TaxID=209389 RepID=A0ABU6MLH3_9BACI|nr:GIY-YIG nuclease family protein [Heyndrickxia acidicola]MED1205534.1 GIY-YIG nuclease family protein [Heyndrickxia acidicola]
MERKKELKQQFKEAKIEAGVYQIRNLENDKVYISSTRNFKTLTGKKFSLEMGTETNKALQKEWNTYGKEAFAFEILETLKDDNGNIDKKYALIKLLEKWMDQIKPFGEKGYH